jgi:hypothetical protein
MAKRQTRINCDSQFSRGLHRLEGKAERSVGVISSSSMEALVPTIQVRYPATNPWRLQKECPNHIPTPSHRSYGAGL